MKSAISIAMLGLSLCVAACNNRDGTSDSFGATDETDALEGGGSYPTAISTDATATSPPTQGTSQAQSVGTDISSVQPTRPAARATSMP